MNNTYAQLNIKVGLPAYRVYRVALPPDRDWWADVAEFEIACQVRVMPWKSSDFIIDLYPYHTISMETADIVRIVFSMTGEQTLLFTAPGYYDLILTDVGATNARGIAVAHGDVRLQALVSEVGGGV